MKNILFPCGIIIGVFFCWFPSYCVAGIQLPPTCVDSKTDQNGFLNELSTEDFNKSTIGALVDGVCEEPDRSEYGLFAYVQCCE